jgi:peptide/nickel transport system permease protein
MTRYIARRLAQALVTILAIVVLNFVILQLAPGDTVDMLAGELGAADPTYLAMLRQKFGLDQTLLVQLGHYLWTVAHFDLGYSFRNNMGVGDLILTRLPATVLLMLTSTLFAVVLGILLGVFSARRVNSIADNLVSGLVLVFYATPLFWLGLMAIVLFTVKLRLLPSDGMETIGGTDDFWSTMLDIGRHLILPAATLALYHIAIYTRLMRASMLEIYAQDFIRTARAKGLTNRAIAYRHVLPNAILPVVTMIGTQLGALLGGAVLVETVFGWPGMGRLAFDAVFARDYNLLLGIMLFAAACVVLVNLATDLFSAWLDPRIKVT